MQTSAERSSAVLERYKKAFSRFSDDEMVILNGIILEPGVADGRSDLRPIPVRYECGELVSPRRTFLRN